MYQWQRFNPEARTPGPVSSHIAGLYVCENTLVVLEATGQQPKEALEHFAKYFGAYNQGSLRRSWLTKKFPPTTLTSPRASLTRSISPSPSANELRTSNSRVSH